MRRQVENLKRWLNAAGGAIAVETAAAVDAPTTHLALELSVAENRVQQESPSWCNTRFSLQN
jgi:hypothetical protein